MDFPSSYLRAGSEYSTLTKSVPAPYFRRSFVLEKSIKSAKLLITGLGYYELHINGADATKGFLAPYRSNPDDYVYFDEYQIGGRLCRGRNVIAVLLGDGMQNAPGAFIWKFEKAPWRGAPQLAFALEIEYEDGQTQTILSDCETKTAPSPILFNDFHMGESYDARREIPDWDMPDFDDSAWKLSETAPAPRGTPRLCEAEPIIVRKEYTPVGITECDGGYVYDFGLNLAGLCRLTINGTAGQRLLLQHFETLVDDKPYLDNNRFHHEDRCQEDEYICSGNGTETHLPRFTYHGFRYVYVTGITAEQATEGLLTLLFMSSDIKKIGSFTCDDEIVNRLQEATVRSDICNFYYFPTDCPQREKNGWTADASLSAEQVLLNLTPERSYREWMRNIYKALNDAGQLPGIIPTAGWGYEWGNGPAWDNVLVYIPYMTYVYRGDRKILEELAVPLMRYLTYLYTRLDENDLIAIGLGDWCQPGHGEGDYVTPLVVTDSILTADIARKASFIYDVLSLPAQKQYADALAARVTAAVRERLIDHQALTVEGDTQTSQAMALYYGMFAESETAGAFAHLLELIDAADGHLDTGVLGGKVIFRVLADNGKADVAYNMITRPDYPSYGNWIKRGATTLWEAFLPENGRILSLNHHFWGDISAWFYRCLAGIRVNPTGHDVQNIDIMPCFVQKLNYVRASHCTPDGETLVEWTRRGNTLELKINIPCAVHGVVRLSGSYTFADFTQEQPLKTGMYRISDNKMG